MSEITDAAASMIEIFCALSNVLFSASLNTDMSIVKDTITTPLRTAAKIADIKAIVFIILKFGMFT